MMYYYSLFVTKLMAEIEIKKNKTTFLRKSKKYGLPTISKAPKKGALLRLFAF